jgi:hypothetical protein
MRASDAISTRADVPLPPGTARARADGRDEGRHEKRGQRNEIDGLAVAIFPYGGWK